MHRIVVELGVPDFIIFCLVAVFVLYGLACEALDFLRYLSRIDSGTTPYRMTPGARVDSAAAPLSTPFGAVADPLDDDPFVRSLEVALDRLEAIAP